MYSVQRTLTRRELERTLSRRVWLLAILVDSVERVFSNEAGEDASPCVCYMCGQSLRITGRMARGWLTFHGHRDTIPEQLLASSAGGSRPGGVERGVVRGEVLGNPGPRSVRGKLR